jgi:hypothetical protein
MKSFSDFFKIHRFPFIKIGSDPVEEFLNFMLLVHTFSALYDKDGELIKAYEKGIKMEELIEALK